MYENIEKIYRERLFFQKPILKYDDIQLQYILNFLPKNKNAFILDAGCGNGKYAFYLSNLGYNNIFAVDLFSKVSTNKFKYYQSSIDNLPFEDASFDFIYSNSVIYYLENPEDAIVEFNRVLKKGGILFLTAHTKYSLFTLWRVFKRDVLKLKSMEHLQGVKFYSAHYYRNLLKRNGFELILQNGYKSSFILEPLYYKIVKVFDKFLNIELPFFNKSVKISSNIIKSEIAYHSVFVVRKIWLKSKLQIII